MKIPYLICLCYITLLTSCKQQFTRDIAPDRHSHPSVYKAIKMLSDSLTLDKIENGFDSLQIRIWIESPFMIGRVVTFKKDAHGWATSLIIYEAHTLDSKYDSIIFFEKKVSQPTLKFQWSELMDSLNNYNIMNLKDQDDIKGYEHPTDGVFYTIEIATKIKYRLYTYHSPGTNIQFKDARRMDEIIEVIKRNTGYDLDGLPDFLKKAP